ncbi:unnamed protein product [Colias eurytheme]|nr:unnamed protein product [Colias eurytheme]
MLICGNCSPVHHHVMSCLPFPHWDHRSCPAPRDEPESFSIASHWSRHLARLHRRDLPRSGTLHLTDYPDYRY